MEEMRAPVDVCSVPPVAVRISRRNRSPCVRSEGALAMKFTDVTPNLIVTNVERSLAFYRDVLGFSVTATVPDAGPFAFAWMQRDGVSVFLNSVESVRAEHAELGARPIGGTATLFMIVEAEESQAGSMGCSPRSHHAPA